MSTCAGHIGRYPMSGDAGFKLIQNGITVAEVSGADRDECLREIMHYAMMYAQDGPCSVRGASDADCEALRAALTPRHGAWR